MPVGCLGSPCQYSGCRWNSGISAPIIKDVLLQAVDNGRSWMCGRYYFVRLNDTLEKGMLRSSTTHTFDNCIGFGWEDKDNWKLTSFEGNVLVADIVLDRLIWQLIPYNLSVVATSLSTIVESAPESKRAFIVTVWFFIFFEILITITC